MEDMDLRDRLLMEIIEAMQSRMADKDYPDEKAPEMAMAAGSVDAKAETPVGDVEMHKDIPPTMTDEPSDEDDEDLMAELHKMHGME